MAALIRRQMIRTGMRHALSPVMDVALDPRWGRVHETSGEDPYLVASLSVAYTRGLQGEDRREGVIATGKHFLGYANPEGGLNSGAIEAGPRRLRDLYAFPFEAAIQLAGLGSVMNTYSEIDGVPVAASREVLTDLLRGQLGFTGFVSSDYGSVEMLVTRQGVATSPGEAGRLALTAGLDVEFAQEFGFGEALALEVEAGRLDVSLVDQAVSRVLTAKFELGLFENPYPSEHIDIAAIAGEGRDLSRELAARGVVLLHNDGVLPLAAQTRVAVVGPHALAAPLQFPAYTYPSWREAVNAIHLGGTGNMVGAGNVADSWYVEHFETVDSERLVADRYGARPLAEALADHVDVTAVVVGSGITSTLGPAALANAQAAARAADVAVLALGARVCGSPGSALRARRATLPTSRCRPCSESCSKQWPRQAGRS